MVNVGVFGEVIIQDHSKINFEIYCILSQLFRAGFVILNRQTEVNSEKPVRQKKKKTKLLFKKLFKRKKIQRSEKYLKQPESSPFLVIQLHHELGTKEISFKKTPEIKELSLDIFYELFSQFGAEHELISELKVLSKNLEKEIAQTNSRFTPIKLLTESLKESYQAGGKIQRLFYPKALPLNENYIHLAVISKKSLDKFQQEFRRARHHGAFNAMYKYAEGVANKSVSQLISEEKQKTNKGFVTGVAGVGKSVMGKYVAYRWALEDGSKESRRYKHWREQFNLLLWFPLRFCLTKQYDKSSVTIADMATGILEHVKSSHEFVQLKIKSPKATALQELKPEQMRFLEEELTLECAAGYVLWILDGYDEVATSLSKRKPIDALLNAILKFPHVIMTSRPYYLEDFESRYRFGVQSQEEVIGFTDENITEYVTAFFAHLPNPKVEKGKALLDFLQVNPNLWAVCHVPINAELVCSTWEKQGFGDNNLTVFQLYDKVIVGLCRRYCEKSKDISTQHDTDETVLRRCKEELDFLSYWAFESLSKGEVVSRLADALYYLKHRGEKQKKFVKKLLEAGFFRAIVGGAYEAEKLYYFPHRTFQEYFAARYISERMFHNESLHYERKLCAPLDYIKKYFYTNDFEMLGWFISGNGCSSR